jgi:hypothetical protein
MKPPAYIDGAKVIKWAWSGPKPFGYVGMIDSPGREDIYGLAICQYENSDSFYRFSCDKYWETVQDASNATDEDAIRFLPLQYANIKADWQSYSRARNFKDQTETAIDNFKSYFIEPDEVNKILQASKLDFLSYNSLLGENILCENFRNQGKFKHRRAQIPHWNDFETEKHELDQELFYNYFLSDLKIDQVIVLITDEGIRQNHAFKFKIFEFYLFSDIYENFFSMEFFQFSFYLAVIPDINTVRFLDENGGINEFIVA